MLRSRRLWAVVIFVLVVVGLAYLLVLNQRAATSVPKASLQQSLTQRLGQTFGEYPTVACDGSISRSRGDTQTCTATDRGDTYHVTVTMTDDHGNNTVAFEPQPPAFAAATLERAVVADYQREKGGTASAAHCPGSLSTTAGDHLTCELTVGDRTVKALLTVGATDASTGVTPFTTRFSRAG